MNFNKVFRGYDPQEVDQYIAKLQQKESDLRDAQKQRIDELSDENYLMRSRLKQYTDNEKAISEALVDSRNLANRLQDDAEKFAQVTLARAKLFYVSWTAYSKTLAASLSADEVRQFNELKQKLEQVINDYEGGNIAEYAAKILELRSKQSADNSDVAAAALAENGSGDGAREVAAQLKPLNKADDTSAVERALGTMTNPIDKVTAAHHAIELKELIRPDESLEDLCKDLGVGTKKDA